MTREEKILRIKLNTALLEISRWKRDWDPDEVRVSKHTTRLYRAFHNYLKAQEESLKKKLDLIEYIDVSS